MEKISIPVFYLEKRTIRGFGSLDEFIDGVKEKEIYVVDVPSFRGRDINFKLLSKIANIYGVWYEANIRWKDDVYDIILSGAKVAVLGTKKVDEEFLAYSLQYTDNIALKSDDEDLVKKFLNMGGKIFITSLGLELPRKFKLTDGRLVEI